MSFEITGDLDELITLTKGIKAAKPALIKATVRAINRTATSTRAEGARMIAKEYRITQKMVKAELHIKKANYNTLEAVIMGSGSPGIALMNFTPTPKRVPSTTRIGRGRYSPKVGIKVMIHRGSRKVVKGAFIAQMGSGHVGVFRRAKDGRWGRKGRKPVIEELFGPSPLRILDSDAYQIPLDEYAAETMDINIAYEAEYYLRKEGVLPRV